MIYFSMHSKEEKTIGTGQNFSAAIEKLPEDGLCNPEHIAEAYWHLANQKKSAWTHEMDLRPYCERF